MRPPLRHLIPVLGIVAATLAACAELATEPPADGEVFDAPFAELSAGELRVFLTGDVEFSRRFAPATGLGPVFNNASCFSCHSADGRGRIENSLVRLGTPDDDFLAHLGGPQIQDRAIAGAVAETVPNGVPLSRRLPPPVFGVGLIEAIPEASILANADPDDANGDGISGRPNWVGVHDYVPGGASGAARTALGRFGRKAQTATLLEQVVEAYHQDMGITSEFRPVENINRRAPVSDDQAVDPEIPAATVHAVVHYVRALAPPAPGADTPARRTGAALFTSVGCAACHTPAFTTGPSPIGALAGRKVEAYSDFLLHDMGEALSDQRPDGQAGAREWRTPPLWGLRLMRRFLDGDAFLMHDGRARTVEDAIRLHGGEGARARAAFSALDAASRRALLDFVESR
jgi:CxxC motif-containing protein (DUF1111 family)